MAGILLGGDLMGEVVGESVSQKNEHNRSWQKQTAAH